MTEEHIAVQYEDTRDASDDTPALCRDPSPWPCAVETETLLDRIHQVIIDYVSVSASDAVTSTLWVALTYFYENLHVLPMLLLTSPEKRCGKTTLLTVLNKLVSRPITVSNITGPAVYRVIDEYQPTLLIDEADTFIAGNNADPEIRGIINSGHTRDAAYVIRLTGPNHQPKKFSTWCPKVIAMIGKPHGTLTDRSLVIQMRRKRVGQMVKRLRADRGIECAAELGSMCLRWAQDHSERISRYDPILPGGLNDRAADNWRPLCAIAEQAGGEWPERTRQAAKEASAAEDDESSSATQLLGDIRQIFTLDRMHSHQLVEKLNDLEDRPWSDWNKAKGITAAQLSKKLRPFDIKSKDMRIDGSRNRKGYRKTDFVDAFDRYLPCLPDPAATPRQDIKNNELPGNVAATGCGFVADKSAGKSLNTSDCRGVAAGEPPADPTSDVQVDSQTEEI